MSIDYLIKNGDATPLLIDCNPRLVEPMGVRTHLSRCRRCSAARPTAARGAIFSARLKPTNKAERSAAELGEPRAGAEGNVGQYSTDRARNRATVSPGLERIRQVSPLNTKGGSRMWESRLYSSVRGRSEMSVPTAIGAHAPRNDEATAARRPCRSDRALGLRYR